MQKIVTDFTRSSQYDRVSVPVTKKRIDDYPPKRDEYSSSSKRDDYSNKRDEYTNKRDPPSYKRPVTDYNKRDVDVSRHSGNNTYENRSAPVSHRDEHTSSSKDSRYDHQSSDTRSAGDSFRANRGNVASDDRDARTSTSTKSRYIETLPSESRYAERTTASSPWYNSGVSQVKSFGGSMASAPVSSGGGGGGDWQIKPAPESWRSIDTNQDRYDRTYNERKTQPPTSSQYPDNPPRQNSFMGRPQDRYNSNTSSSRFENGRF